MNPRALLRSPAFLPERRSLRSTGSFTAHLAAAARGPSLNFQKTFLFVSSSGSNGSGRRAFSTRWEGGGGGKGGGGDKRVDRGVGFEHEYGKEEEVDEGIDMEGENLTSTQHQKVNPDLSITAKGTLLPTSSHLLKLLLPLAPTEPPLALLLHPRQPLSYLSHLLHTELSCSPNITFKTIHHHPNEYVRWGASTELCDLLQDAARALEFAIAIPGREELFVRVPGFAQRTRFLRRRLRGLTSKIEAQGAVKESCDRLAHVAAWRVAAGGFAALVGWWWAGVYWLTFGTSLGWDVVEPITYLAVGLWAVICGYLFLLHRDWEVSCRSRRQMRLYRQKGFDIDRWEELVQEGKALRHEIGVIAEEYNVDWDEASDGVGGEKVGGWGVEGGA